MCQRSRFLWLRVLAHPHQTRRTVPTLTDNASRAAKVIELRFFGGLTETEAAEALDISATTLRRDWDFARSWLASQLG